MFNKKTGNLLFFSVKINLSIRLNTYGFFQIFFFAKKLRPTLKKFLKIFRYTGYSKIRKKSEENHVNFCWTILFHKFINNCLELLICKTNIISTFQMVDFLTDFCLIRRYSKYSLNLTFDWECNDTRSLR